MKYFFYSVTSLFALHVYHKEQIALNEKAAEFLIAQATGDSPDHNLKKKEHHQKCLHKVNRAIKFKA